MITMKDVDWLQYVSYSLGYEEGLRKKKRRAKKWFESKKGNLKNA